VLYRFGPFELDEARSELRREGRVVAIQPKPLALLALLLRERERVVPADEILGTLWPDTVVTPGSLNRAVSHARRAIGDTHRGRLIQSVSRRGYRFTGEVVTIDAGARAGVGAAPAAERPFVGRSDALARLRDAFAAAVARREGALALISGPPGIGKTRLTEVAAAQLEAAGALALVGRAREGEGVPAFWLFAQVLRRLLEQPAAAEALREVAAHAGELAGLLGLRPADGAAPRAPAAAAPEASRFLLFDAVTRALLRAARRRPLLIVLEDLQWAGSESLRLLEHLAHERLDAPLLVLGTVREEPRAAGSPVTRALSLLRAQDRCLEIALEPFSRGEVAALLEQVLGRPAPPDLTSELFARSEGVPLFVREALRLLEERGALAEPERVPREGVVLPARALDLIRRPLERLSPAAASLVSAAAVLGRDFHLPAAAAVAGLARADALDRIDEAVLAGVLEAAPGGATAFRFTHALFQEAALAALSPGARARLHLRAAEHLERENAGDLSAVLAELAHHHHRALAVGDPERACRAALRAAEQGSRLGAWEQAAIHYEQAREAFEQVPGCDPVRRLALALDCTEAWRLASERSRRRQRAREAFELARALGRPREMAQAAIGLLDLQEWGVGDEFARAAVEEALAALPDSGSVEEARLLTRLAYLDIRHVYREASGVARRAVELARAAGDPDALQDALYTLHFSIGGPEGLAEREELAREIEAVAAASRSADRALIALLDTAGDRFELGDRPGALRLREAAGRVAGRRPHPGMRWHLEVYDTGVALLEGRLGEVEARARAAYSVGLRAEHPYARGCFDAHRALLARARGESGLLLETLAPALRARQGPTHWVKAVVARAELEAGRSQDARARFDNLAARGFADVPRNLRWTATLVEIAHLCAELEAEESAAALHALLAPYADHHAVLPMAICYGGPVSYALARLAELRGRRGEARELYRAALAACQQIGAESTRARVARHASRAA
jgi:DNA-binding winged helix-turn-helix (wHTH) protein